jgi:Glycosyltransferase family 87
MGVLSHVFPLDLLAPEQRDRTGLSRTRSGGFHWYLLTGLWCALLGIGVGALIIGTIKAATGSQTDFCRDYSSALALVHGQAVYHPIKCSSAFLYLPGRIEYNSHPPTSILLFAPFGLLAEIPATLLWGFLLLAAYMVSGWLLIHTLHWKVLPGLGLFAISSVLWQPAVQAIQWLNMDQVLLLLLVGVWLLKRRRQDAWAGVLLGVAGLLKIWPLVILVIPLLQQRWRLVAVAGSVVVVGCLLALLLEGPSAFLAYLGPVRVIEQAWAEAAKVENVSVLGAVTGLLLGYRGTSATPTPLVHSITPGMAALLGEALGAGLLGGGIWLLWWKQRLLQDEVGDSLAFGLVLSLILLCFPLTWLAGIIVLLLPATTLLLALRHLPRPPTWWWWILGASLLLLNLLYLPLLLLLINRLLQLIWHGQPVLGLLDAVEPASQTLGLLLFTGALAYLLVWHGERQPYPRSSCTPAPRQL